MRVKVKLLIPGVENAEEPDLCAEVSRILSDFHKSFHTGTKQEVVDGLPVL
jgi:hypothetical protein